MSEPDNVHRGFKTPPAGGLEPPAAAAPPAELAAIVDELWAEHEALVAHRVRRLSRQTLPSRTTLIEVMNRLKSALFPAHFGTADFTVAGARYYVGATLDAALNLLRSQVFRALCYSTDCLNERECEQRSREIIATFASGLPEIRRLLASDVRAALAGDPALTNLDEAVFCYPGVAALIYHRIAHALYRLRVPLIPRIISERAHSQTGIDIHPGAEIGGAFFIDHGTGVVIGETAIIGAQVRIYQGVTLGAKSFPLDDAGQPLKGLPRHPIVEDGVVIYAGATILGRVTIGRGSSVGGNVWLTRSVPPMSRITQAQSRLESFEEGAGI